ncbi:hypothetical protein BHE74_00017737 [Ensete ventricosum]|nr:hypothetical protein BHE74_00017737 [Ensete ventricosum]
MVKTEGFFSLYKGLVPSLISMAPSAAVFYSVYDILKSAYLHSPEGMKRLALMKQQEGEEVNALDQLELGPVRTLLYGAIAGACAEVTTYPFEVVRRHLQMQLIFPKSRLPFSLSYAVRPQSNLGSGERSDVENLAGRAAEVGVLWIDFAASEVPPLR